MFIETGNEIINVSLIRHIEKIPAAELAAGSTVGLLVYFGAKDTVMLRDADAERFMAALHTYRRRQRDRE